MRWLARCALLLLALPATVQAQELIANGQVFLPGGRPPNMEIRFQLKTRSFSRPPELHYTDSRGRFQISVQANVMYIITVESDGETWETTTTEFLPSGMNPRVDVFLLPYRRESPAPKTDAVVTVSGLQQNVPGNARKEFEAGVKSAQKGDISKGRQHLQRAIELFPDYLDARNELGALLMRENKMAEAEAHFRKAVEVDPQAARPLLNLGLCLSRQERFADAAPFLERAAQTLPNEATAQFLLGVALLMTGKEADAERQLLRAYELGGSKIAQAQFYLAKLYLARGDAPRTITALEKYLQDVPQDPSAPQIRATIQQLREQQKTTP